MSIITSCPHCRGQISLPEGSGPSRRMRCPLCDAIFTVADTVIVAQPAAPRAVPVVEEATASAGSVKPVGPDAGPRGLRIEYVTETTAPEVAASSRASRHSSGVASFFRHLTGIVLGGAAGLVIGYCILLRIGGPRVDFLNLAPWLPAAIVGEASDDESANNAPPAIPFVPSEPPAERVERRPLAELFPPSDDGAGSTRTSPVLPSTSDLADDFPEDADVLPPDYLGPRDIVWYTSADLGLALAEAHRSLGCERCRSTGRVTQLDVEVQEIDGRPIEKKAERLVECPVCHGEPVAKITPRVYQQLAQLAEVVTFISIADDDPDIWTRKDAVIHILEQSGAKRERAKAIGRLAGEWLRDANRDTNGIALAGTVQETGREGPFHRTRIVLFGLPHVVTVLSQRPAPFQPQDRVIVLGSIIDAPAERLAGYRGTEAQIVWGGLPMTLAYDEN